MLWICSFLGRFEFQEGLSVFPIWKVAVISTTFSWWFPGSYWPVNGGKWDDYAAFSIFMLMERRTLGGRLANYFEPLEINQKSADI